MMEPEPPIAIGLRIRALRARRQLSLRALAERCNLSINAISQIERGESSQTVASLHQLATALGVPIIDLFRQETEQPALFVAAEARLRIEADGVRMESLGLGLPYQQIEPFLVTVQPGAGNADQPVTHAGEEFVHCLAGEFVYHVGRQSYHLRAGDSLLFEPAQPHAFHNPAATPAVFLLIILTGDTRRGAQQLHLGQEPAQN